MSEANLRLEALKQVFDRDCHTVKEGNGGALGDYQITSVDTCINKRKRIAFQALGFRQRSIHSRIVERNGQELSAIVLYLEDNRQ